MRARARYGAAAALFALLLQFAAAFGHYHAVAVVQADTVGAATATACAPDITVATAQHPCVAPVDHGGTSDSHQHDVCAVCVVLALAHATLDVVAPTLPPLDVTERPIVVPATPVVHLEQRRARYQPRAPPAA